METRKDLNISTLGGSWPARDSVREGVSRDDGTGVGFNLSDRDGGGIRVSSEWSWVLRLLEPG